MGVLCGFLVVGIVFGLDIFFVWIGFGVCGRFFCCVFDFVGVIDIGGLGGVFDVWGVWCGLWWSGVYYW